MLLRRNGFDAVLAAENCHPDDRARIRPMPAALAEIAPEDIVIFQFSTEDPAFPAVAALPNPKIVFYQNITPERFFRGTDDRTADLVKQGLAQRGLCSRFDVVMANSRATAAALVEGLPADQAAGIDLAQIVPCPPVIGVARWDSIATADAPTGSDERLVLFVGRLVPHKGIEDLIAGFARLASTDKHVRLAIVGGPSQSDYAQGLKHGVAELEHGIASRITFHHDISEDDLKRLYQQAAVCASMSRHEGFGVPLLDAMFFGKPLVIRAEPGMIETAGDAAIVVAEPTPEATAAALGAALNDEQVRANLAGGRARQLEELRSAADGRRIINAIAEARTRWRARQRRSHNSVAPTTPRINPPRHS
ncbi:glycosyltransferase [Rhodopseudomonas sp. WA056]|uniref:glycosyltransferase family 4 protein n=1 Tax=Rhodopseudomonas sp. WA056 TaxID=2269367 RepID=UPI0013DF2F96|nr:glycosyltransferase family 4 protein [Rhodopseudomonas sp. WA056]NEW89230.1 glycosyltransferase [Rhodopseudomonas sp. WA056]